MQISWKNVVEPEFENCTLFLFIYLFIYLFLTQRRAAEAAVLFCAGSCIQYHQMSNWTFCHVCPLIPNEINHLVKISNYCLHCNFRPITFVCVPVGIKLGLRLGWFFLGHFDWYNKTWNKKWIWLNFEWRVELWVGLHDK